MVAVFDLADRDDISTRLNELAGKVRIPVIVDRIWNRLLTERERREITDDDGSPDIIHIWMRLRSVGYERAILDLARGTNFLTEADYEWLLRQLGELRVRRAPGLEWDRPRGELRLDGDVIRTIARVGAATNVVRVLDTFQEEGWPEHIFDPIPDGDAQKLRETLRSLNEGLTRFRFRADGTGEGILLERA